MKSVIYKGPGEFAIEERPEPSIKNPDDVKIKVLGVCICGTDINIFATPQKHPSRPGIIFGHEFGGQVVEVGSAVTNLKPGDKVIVDPHGPCGYCDACLAGWPERCENLYLKEPGLEGQANGMGVFKDGGLTSYTIVPNKFAYKISNDTPDEFLPLAEPLECCGYSIEKLNIHVGDTVCVLGAGPIGLLYVALAKANGAAKIIVSEPIEYRRNKALEIGATRVVDPNVENIASVCMEETGGIGVDHCIEAVAAMLMDAIECVRARGKVLQCGHDEITVAPVRVGEVLKKEVEIHGAFLGKYYMAKVARIIESGLLPLDKIVTHKFPITEYGKALDLARSGQCVKVVVVPE